MPEAIAKRPGVLERKVPTAPPIIQPVKPGGLYQYIGLILYFAPESTKLYI